MALDKIMKMSRLGRGYMVSCVMPQSTVCDSSKSRSICRRVVGVISTNLMFVKGLWSSRLLMGELLLSSTHLEQARPQPQHKGSPGPRGFPFSRLVALRRLKAHVVCCWAGCLVGRNGIVSRAGEAELFVIVTQTRGCVFTRVGQTNVGVARDPGNSITRDARGANASLAVVLGESMRISALGAVLLADLLACVLFLLCLLLLLELASCLANVVLAGSGVDLTSRSETEATHIKRSAQRRHGIGR